jgi:hypothetical protein
VEGPELDISGCRAGCQLAHGDLQPLPRDVPAQTELQAVNAPDTGKICALQGDLAIL